MLAQLYDIATGKENQGLIGLQELESGIADCNYVHNQAIPSTDWVINHNLGKIPSVTLTMDDIIVYTTVEHIDINQCIVHWNSANIGKATCN